MKKNAFTPPCIAFLSVHSMMKHVTTRTVKPTKMHTVHLFLAPFDRSLVSIASLMDPLIVGSYHSSPRGQCPASIEWHCLSTNLSSLSKCRKATHQLTFTLHYRLFLNEYTVFSIPITMNGWYLLTKWTLQVVCPLACALRDPDICCSPGTAEYTCLRCRVAIIWLLLMGLSDAVLEPRASQHLTNWLIDGYVCGKDALSFRFTDNSHWLLNRLLRKICQRKR